MGFLSNLDHLGRPSLSYVASSVAIS